MNRISIEDDRIINLIMAELETKGIPDKINLASDEGMKLFQDVCQSYSAAIALYYNPEHLDNNVKRKVLDKLQLESFGLYSDSVQN